MKHARHWLLLWLCAFSTSHGAPQRIVTLSPHATELVIAAGAADRLVGVAIAPGQTRPQSVNHPIEAVSSLGGIDREQLLRLQPDLAVAWTSGNRPADLRWLENNHVRVFRSEPTTLSDIAKDIRKLGRMLETSAQAERAASEFEHALAATCPSPAHRKVLIAIWPSPFMSVGGEHWLNDALGRVGLRNTFASIDRNIFSPDPETLLRQSRLPQLVLHPWRRQGDLDGRGLSRPAPSMLPALRRLCRQSFD